MALRRLVSGKAIKRTSSEEGMVKITKAGVDGGRTHRGPQSDPPPVLKTGKPTGT